MITTKKLVKTIESGLIVLSPSISCVPKSIKKKKKKMKFHSKPMSHVFKMQ